MDGLTASPHTHSAPPSHGMHAVAVAVAVAGQRPALPQVQGCKPCRTPRTESRTRTRAPRPSLDG
ncbi:hypothetical protein D7Y44_21370 [Stenotrophomonas maltophilia]|nr:hypothetical protein [Stenotrophomonas maltophilia]MBA0345024.1 hypothetical protein [Stenotrophomonas maltophilia]MBA0359976.1 hypothetical protein [Stenotrophomonas maltophilia]MBA0518516.1 hypothetical protein [Stenotrophomonas maltophilia]